MHMLHHVSLGVTNIDHAAKLYDAMLAPLGYIRVWSDLRSGEPDQAVGYGLPGGGDKLALKLRPDRVGVGAGFHLAFTAPNHEAVEAFYKEAIQHGSEDNGPPGYRLHYGSNYYAAFIEDPDGHHLEAVCNTPSAPAA